jgi:hypothetical protein
MNNIQPHTHSSLLFPLKGKTFSFICCRVCLFYTRHNVLIECCVFLCRSLVIKQKQNNNESAHWSWIEIFKKKTKILQFLCFRTVWWWYTIITTSFITTEKKKKKKHHRHLKFGVGGGTLRASCDKRKRRHEKTGGALHYLRFLYITNKQDLKVNN